MTGRGTRGPPLRPKPAVGADAGRPGHARTTPPRQCCVARYPERSASSFLANDDIGRVRMFHSNDVVAGIDVMNLARHAAREVAEEIDRSVADLLNRDAAAQRRVVLVPFEDVAEVTDARRRQRLDRAGGDGIDANVLLAQIGGEVAHGRL